MVHRQLLWVIEGHTVQNLPDIALQTAVMAEIDFLFHRQDIELPTSGILG